MPPRYYGLRESASYSDATIHTDRDCPDGPVRAAPPSLTGDRCPECFDVGDGSDPQIESDTDTDTDADTDESVETCTVVKQDGDICGRELPCRYHS